MPDETWGDAAFSPTVPAGGLGIRLLGGFQVIVAARPIAAAAWRRSKAAGLVKLLALAMDHRLHREQILEVLWPAFAPAAATNNLHRTLHAARRALEPALVRAGAATYLRFQGEMLLLAPDGPVWTDLEAFRAAAGAARRTHQMVAYEAALALYAGDLLPEDPYAEWAAGPREAARSTALALRLELADAYAAQHESEPAIAVLQRLLGDEPTHQPAHLALMRLYAAAGRRDLALGQYEQLRVALRRDLDSEPDEAARQLYGALLARRPPAPAMVQTRGRPPADRLAGPPPTNLPAPLTSFIGRERELAGVVRLLGETRLLTLTGAGGCGKTRLALEAAAEARHAYPDGVWLVDLAPLTDPSLVSPAVAAPLGVREEAGRPLTATLADHLRTRQTLLVLDNCEHLLDDCAALAEALLRACPGIQILATSREALRLAGETAWPIPALPAPDPDCPPERVAHFDAVRLFVERARATRPGFGLTPANAAAVAAICRRLDGIPLAIELAAARVGALAPAAIAARLDDVFALLVAGSRTAPPRHRTLRGVMDWSHDLLTTDERILFRRLAVFAGGFPLEAAAAVGAREGASNGAREPSQADSPVLPAAPAPSLTPLTRLVDQSLVLLEETDGQVRYRLLEPVRQYARERLGTAGEEPAARAQHRDWCLGLAEAAEPTLRGPDQVATLEQLRAEHDNLRAALAWCLEIGATTAGLRLAAALWRFWRLRGHLAEGRRWLEALLAHGAAADSAARSAAVAGAGHLARVQGDHTQAAARFAEGLALCRARGDARGAAEALDGLAATACDQRDYARAAALHEESLALFRAIGDTRGTAEVLTNLGRVMNDLGTYDQAAALHAEALVLFRGLGDTASVAATLINLAVTRTEQGDYAQATALHEESLALRRELGDTPGIATTLTGLGRLARLQGDYARAVALTAEGLALRRALGARWGIAISLANLAMTVHAQGDHAAAAALHAEALILFQEVGDSRGVGWCLEELARVSAARGRPQRAARLFGAAAAVRAALSAPQSPRDRADHDQSVAAVRQALGPAAVAAAWAAGEALTSAQAVAEALGEAR